MVRKTNIQFSFRVYDGKRPFLGPGRVQLLQLIEKHGSIAKAADAMAMSYRKAWQMVKDLNAMTEKPMVEIRLGGPKGGGARVTVDGVKAMQKYFTLKQKADEFFTKTLQEIDF